MWVALLEPFLPAAAALEVESRSWAWAVWVGVREPVLPAAAGLEVESRTRVWAVWAALLQAPRLGIQLQLFGTKVGMTAALLGLLGEAGIVLPLIQPAWLP